MATGFRDFTLEAPTTTVSGLTARNQGNQSDMEIISETPNRLRIDPPTFAECSYVIDAAAISTDQSIYAEFSIRTDNDRRPGLAGRITDSLNTENGNHQQIMLRVGAEDVVELHEYFNDALVTEDSAAVTIAGATIYAMTLEISGSTATAKVWEKAGTEPSTPTVSINIASLTTGGLLGLATRANGDVDFYVVGWGTDGDVAPRSAAPPSSVSITGPLQPGASISGTYSNFSGVPTALTLTDSNTNSISSASEIADLNITDNGDGTGSFTFTMPGLPAAGNSQNSLLFGDITAELTT